MGTKADGSDSYAVQVAPQSHWPEMHAIICVVSDAKKGTSSTAGMQNTVETSALLQHRIQHVVPQRMKEITKAILEKDFETFATVTMRDSNQFHAVALDTFPPIFYMNDTSRAIVQVITEYNRTCGKIKAAYTYDAGPNAVIYTLRENVKEIVSLLLHYFPLSQTYEDPSKLFEGEGTIKTGVPPGFNEGVAKVAAAGVGDGPRVLKKDEESLLNSAGLPIGVSVE
ncbi:diphosphomevalonate decarboxylase [Serendipita sp. 399]|nr:diphosphomevalonate decarboxylase [Serendipita sp. 399]